VSLTNLMLTVLMIGALFFIAGQRLALAFRSSSADRLHSLPHYHGMWAAITSALPALFVLLVIVIGKDLLFQFWARDYFPQDVLDGDAVARAIALAKISNLVDGIDFGEIEPWVQAAGSAWIRWEANAIVAANFLVLTVSIAGGLLGYRKIHTSFRSRNNVERILTWILIGSSLVAILTTIGIVLSVLFESIRFFNLIPPQDFLFGLEWNPQFEGAERAGSGGGTATYGMIPMFVGTFLISAIALIVAVPVGLFSAIYLAEYATPRIRGVVKPLLEILAGVPTVVYGFFAALTVAPFVKSLGESMGIEVASESALAAGLVMGMMIIPFISSLSDDVINAVPQSLRDAAYGLGSTRSEAVRLVVLPAALPGIVAAVILAVSRAVGETMIVVMAAGLAANLSFNPLDAVTTVTSQIVTILVGDQEFESAKTLSAFALALMLIVTTLALNYFALQIVKRYREQYD